MISRTKRGGDPANDLLADSRTLLYARLVTLRYLHRLRGSRSSYIGEEEGGDRLNIRKLTLPKTTWKFGCDTVGRLAVEPRQHLRARLLLARPEVQQP